MVRNGPGWRWRWDRWRCVMATKLPAKRTMNGGFSVPVRNRASFPSIQIPPNWTLGASFHSDHRRARAIGASARTPEPKHFHISICLACGMYIESLRILSRLLFEYIEHPRRHPARPAVVFCRRNKKKTTRRGQGKQSFEMEMDEKRIALRFPDCLWRSRDGRYGYLHEPTPNQGMNFDSQKQNRRNS